MLRMAQLKLIELYFGDLEAFDEARNEPKYFEKTFVVPDSVSAEGLRNNRRFIVVGRKGVGKTAIQMRLAEQLHQQGYLTCFFRFSEDLRADDYSDISKTQSQISFSSIENDRQIFVHYDFRDVWERVFFNRVAQAIKDNGFQNNFTRLACPDGSNLKNIFSDLGRALTIKVSADFGAIAAEVGFDPSKIEKGEVSLKEYNRVSRELFARHCSEFRVYMFIDELVFSRLDARDDEVRIRAAMVRDIVKTCRELNNLCAQNNLDFHFICSLRPEVRNLINDYDSEIGKVVDGKDASLTWYMDSGREQSLLDRVLSLKVKHSSLALSTRDLNDELFIDQTVTFGRSTLSLQEFLRTNTWGRPRDIVRLLLSIQKMNPNASRIGQSEIKRALDEYSRASAKELVDELSVLHGQEILRALRKGVTRKTYNDAADLLASVPLPKVNEEKFVEELFLLGLIGGFQPETGNYYWAHRGETNLKPHLKIRIHPALWNEFSIRGAE